MDSLRGETAQLESPYPEETFFGAFQLEESLGLRMESVLNQWKRKPVSNLAFHKFEYPRKIKLKNKIQIMEYCS
jgi:hypothetical protein